MKQDKLTRMGTMPIGKLLTTMSLPMMLSFLIQALYNIVDSMFVAQISENALTAVSLAFPMQQIMIALSVGISVGVSAIWPRYMGEGKKADAAASIHTANMIYLLVSLTFLVLGLFASGPLYRAQTDVQEIADYGKSYLTIIWAFAFGNFFGKYYERLLVSAGHATLSTIALASGAVFNLIFDPLLIFGIGPFPELGIRGAAIATVAGQIFAAILALVLNLRFNEAVRPDLFKLKLRLKLVAAIFRVGMPSMVTLGLNSLTGFLINQILLTYSTTATAVYGVWMKLQNFSHMPIYGMDNCLVPILSYNYGIGKYERVHKTMNTALFSCFIMMIVLSIVLEFIPDVILHLFNASDTMLQMGRVCLRICVASLPFAAMALIFATCNTALDHARYALVINGLRQFALLIGAFYLLSLLFPSQLEYVWLAVLITELVTFVVALLLNRKFRKDLRQAEAERMAAEQAQA